MTNITIPLWNIMLLHLRWETSLRSHGHSTRSIVSIASLIWNILLLLTLICKNRMILAFDLAIGWIHSSVIMRARTVHFGIISTSWCRHLVVISNREFWFASNMPCYISITNIHFLAFNSFFNTNWGII